MKRTVQDGFRAQKYGLSLVCKAIFLIIFLSPFQQLLGQENQVGIDQIRAGMDQISAGFSENGIRLLRNGRALLFQMRNDPFCASLIEVSLREEARAELQLASKSSAFSKELHLQAAEKLLENLPPSLETYLLKIELLKLQGKRELALQKIDEWLQGEQLPIEKGLLLFAKSTLLFDDEKNLQQALATFESVHYEGEETQKIRLLLAKKAENRGDLTEAVRILSKIVNNSSPSPLITEVLNLRGELLEKLGRPDLKEKQRKCGN